MVALLSGALYRELRLDVEYLYQLILELIEVRIDFTALPRHSYVPLSQVAGAWGILIVKKALHHHPNTGSVRHQSRHFIRAIALSTLANSLIESQVSCIPRRPNGAAGQRCSIRTTRYLPSQ